LLERAYNLALQGGVLLSKPHIPMLAENNVRQGFFELGQFEAVRRHLPEHHRSVVTFAYITGWRRNSEILPLQWLRVDFSAGMVRLEVGTTKNKEGREFPLDVIDELRTTLEDQWQKTQILHREKGIIIPWVFWRWEGERIMDFRKAWKTACQKAGAPGGIKHDFRRTAVRNLVRAGVPEKIAMIMTGHKTRSVFDRYDIVSEEDLREAGRKLNAMMGGMVTKTITVAQDHAQPANQVPCN
jgi:integrase